MCSMKSGSALHIIVTMVFLTTFEYHNLTTNAIRILNVRNIHKVQPRSLIYPPTAPTRLQFIGGIGIPVEDLHIESVTSGYVLKAEYFLPEETDQLRHEVKPQTINRRRKSINETDYFNSNGGSDFNEDLSISEMKRNQKHGQKQEAVYRWIVYKAIEMVLKNSGLNGHVCMLRSICEHAAVPLNYENGLISEILHIILTPSTSRDDIQKPSHKNYLKAQILGNSGENCAFAFRECTKSPMELISAVFEY